MIETIKSSPEAHEWIQQRQQQRIKKPKGMVHAYKDFQVLELDTTQRVVCLTCCVKRHSQVTFEQEVLSKAKEGVFKANGEALLEALEIVDAQVESLKAKGDDEGAVKAINDFFAANKVRLNFWPAFFFSTFRFASAGEESEESCRQRSWVR